MITIGDIKVESLKLMFSNSSTLTIEDLPNLLNNPSYSDIAIKMNGSIARCLKRIEVLRKVPCKVSQPLLVNNVNGVFSIDLGQIGDFYKMGSLDLYDSAGIHRQQPYTGLTDKEIIVERNGTYRAVYTPELPMYTDSTPDSTEIPLPDNIAVLIPIYVKGELIEDSEPMMAVQAMNIFEEKIAEIDVAPTTIQKRVKRVI